MGFALVATSALQTHGRCLWGMLELSVCSRGQAESIRCSEIPVVFSDIGVGFALS